MTPPAKTSYVFGDVGGEDEAFPVLDIQGGKFWRLIVSTGAHPRWQALCHLNEPWSVVQVLCSGKGAANAGRPRPLRFGYTPLPRSFPVSKNHLRKFGDVYINFDRHVHVLFFWPVSFFHQAIEPFAVWEQYIYIFPGKECFTIYTHTYIYIYDIPGPEETTATVCIGA